MARRFGVAGTIRRSIALSAAFLVGLSGLMIGGVAALERASARETEIETSRIAPESAQQSGVAIAIERLKDDHPDLHARYVRTMERELGSRAYFMSGDELARAGAALSRRAWAQKSPNMDWETLEPLFRSRIEVATGLLRQDIGFCLSEQRSREAMLGLTRDDPELAYETFLSAAQLVTLEAGEPHRALNQEQMGQLREHRPFVRAWMSKVGALLRDVVDSREYPGRRLEVQRFMMRGRFDSKNVWAKCLVAVAFEKTLLIIEPEETREAAVRAAASSIR